ncbi:bcl-2-like protein 15 [Labrus bergylta]|uniref:bcl-2-like protein 15 n=1 Tax=Labrus bergylta TaxID=56723 RepID=UPI003314419B
MAPTETTTVEWQTSEIIKCLLWDEEDIKNRSLNPVCAFGEVEPDGPDDDDFDPVLIADKLRRVADALNEDLMFQAALADLKQAAAQEAVDAAFSKGVDSVFQSQVLEQAEVASEMQLIKASVAFGLYIKKSCPGLKSQVQSAMTSFLTRRVGTWVSQQGGWDKVKV